MNASFLRPSADHRTLDTRHSTPDTWHSSLSARLGVAFSVQAGRWGDYLALAQYHYRADRPATVCQVWRLEAAWEEDGRRGAGTAALLGRGEDEIADCKLAPRRARRCGGPRNALPSVAAKRPDGHPLALSPHPSLPASRRPGVLASSPCPLLWRMGGYPSLAGVLVVSYPVLQATARNLVTAKRYCTRPDRRVGNARLNREVRTISRVIIHPLYRGLGLASRLVAQAIGRIDTPMVEAFARMGQYVPFFRQAGMAELRLPDRPVYYYCGASI